MSLVLGKRISTEHCSRLSTWQQSPAIRKTKMHETNKASGKLLLEILARDESFQRCAEREKEEEEERGVFIDTIRSYHLLAGS